MVVLALHWPWTIIYQARVSGQSITLLLHLFAPGWRLATWVLCPRHSYHYHHQLESILFVTKKWLRIWSNEIIFCQMISSMNLHGMTQEKFTHNVTPLLLYAVSLSLSLSQNFACTSTFRKWGQFVCSVFPTYDDNMMMPGIMGQ